jgi:hypothetical protein
LLVYLLHYDLCHVLEYCGRQSPLALNGPLSIWFVVQSVLIDGQECLIELGDSVAELLDKPVIRVYRQLYQLQPRLQILAMKRCVVFITVVVLIPVYYGYWVRTIHVLDVRVYAWLSDTVVDARYRVVQLVISQLLEQPDVIELVSLIVGIRQILCTLRGYHY